MTKRKILFILPWLPYPLNSGGKQAIYNGIAAIQKEMKIFITYPEDQGTVSDLEKQHFAESIDGDIKILPYLAAKKTTNWTIGERISGRIKRILDKACPPRPQHSNPYNYWIEELLPKPKGFIDYITTIIEQYGIDIVQSEMLRNLAFVHTLPSSVKSVFVHHELGFVRHKLELAALHDDKYNGQAYAETSKALEIAQLNRYDCVITLSPIDSKKLKLAGVSTNVQDSFAIVKTHNVQIGDTTDSHSLTFVGPDIHTPNYLGINWFLENCWNLLLSQDPKYHLTIIGKWSVQNIADLTSKYPNLTFTGFVDSLEKALANTIMIVPITVGSGIRMKILEASSIGVPFISTSVGAEGIPAENGKDCLIADTPKDFVDAIMKMKNADLRVSCIQNAHHLVEQRYSMEALTSNRIKIYNSLFE